MKHHLLTTAALLLVVLTVLGERLELLAGFALHLLQDPASPALTTLPVVALRSLARQQLGPAARPGGRRIAQANRASLLVALA